MVRFRYFEAIYVFESGKIKPKDETSTYLNELYKFHLVGAWVPDAELDFLNSLGVEILEYIPDEPIEGAIY